MPIKRAVMLTAKVHEGTVKIVRDTLFYYLGRTIIAIAKVNQGTTIINATQTYKPYKAIQVT